jgi:hypothetical protein
MNSLERLEASPPMIDDGAVVATAVEKAGNRTMDGKKTLDLGVVLEALSLPFAPPDGHFRAELPSPLKHRPPCQ